MSCEDTLTILMPLVNLIHCCPLDAPENIFRHLSPINPSIETKLIDTSNGWIAAYGPWLNDDGSYKSDSDEKVSSVRILG